jgi:limonene-1,2-epoxide hydrolase
MPFPDVGSVCTLTGNESANDDLVRQFVAAWERRDTEFVLACFTDDVVYHAIPLTPIVGKAAVEEWVRGFSNVPPGCLHVHHQVASGDVVMNERTDYITLNGRPVTLPICATFDIRDGKITAWREYFDLTPARAAYA